MKPLFHFRPARFTLKEHRLAYDGPEGQKPPEAKSEAPPPPINKPNEGPIEPDKRTAEDVKKAEQEEAARQAEEDELRNNPALEPPAAEPQAATESAPAATVTPMTEADQQAEIQNNADMLQTVGGMDFKDPEGSLQSAQKMMEPMKPGQQERFVKAINERMQALGLSDRVQSTGGTLQYKEIPAGEVKPNVEKKPAPTKVELGPPTTPEAKALQEKQKAKLAEEEAAKKGPNAPKEGAPEQKDTSAEGTAREALRPLQKEYSEAKTKLDNAKQRENLQKQMDALDKDDPNYKQRSEQMQKRLDAIPQSDADMATLEKDVKDKGEAMKTASKALDETKKNREKPKNVQEAISQAGKDAEDIFSNPDASTWEKLGAAIALLATAIAAMNGELKFDKSENSDSEGAGSDKKKEGSEKARESEQDMKDRERIVKNMKENGVSTPDEYALRKDEIAEKKMKEVDQRIVANNDVILHDQKIAATNEALIRNVNAQLADPSLPADKRQGLESQKKDAEIELKAVKEKIAHREQTMAELVQEKTGIRDAVTKDVEAAKKMMNETKEKANNVKRVLAVLQEFRGNDSMEKLVAGMKVSVDESNLSWSVSISPEAAKIVNDLTKDMTPVASIDQFGNIQPPEKVEAMLKMIAEKLNIKPQGALEKPLEETPDQAKPQTDTPTQQPAETPEEMQKRVTDGFGAVVDAAKEGDISKIQSAVVSFNAAAKEYAANSGPVFTDAYVPRVMVIYKDELEKYVTYENGELRMKSQGAPQQSPDADAKPTAEATPGQVKEYQAVAQKLGKLFEDAATMWGGNKRTARNAIQITEVGQGQYQIVVLKPDLAKAGFPPKTLDMIGQLATMQNRIMNLQELYDFSELVDRQLQKATRTA